MKKILITRKLIKSSEEYAASIFDVKLNKEDRVLTKDEVISQSNDCDGILTSLTEKLDVNIYSFVSKIVLTKEEQAIEDEIAAFEAELAAELGQ